MNGQKRNYGIDLLRLVAMMMVVGLHVYGKGDILNNVNDLEWIPYIMMYCAEDCYALITGIVSYSDKEKEIKYAKYITMWFQVVFYGILVITILKVFNLATVSWKAYFNAILPITRRQYW